MTNSISGIKENGPQTGMLRVTLSTELLLCFILLFIIQIFKYTQKYKV